MTLITRPIALRPLVLVGGLFPLIAGCGSGSPTTRVDTPDRTGQHKLIFERWEHGSGVAAKLRTDLSEVWISGLRPSAVRDYHREAYEGFKSIPRDCGDSTVNALLDVVTQAERDITDVYDQSGSDSKFERLTPDEVAIWGGKDRFLGVYFKIRDSSPATERINNTIVQWREKIRNAEAEAIDSVERNHKERPAPW